MAIKALTINLHRVFNLKKLSFTSRFMFTYLRQSTVHGNGVASTLSLKFVRVMICLFYIFTIERKH